MKTYAKIILLTALVAISFSVPGSSQQAGPQKVVLHTEQFTGPTHISKEDFPKGNVINIVEGWGGLAVSINEPPAGTDYTPFLKGQKDNLCQVPHWGYLEKGKIRIIDKDNNTLVVGAGEVFYMPPGHTVIVDEDARTIEFSPEKGLTALNEDVLKILAEMQSKE